MQLSQYFSHNDGLITFTEEQGSAFAKGVAGDFNPIHDQGSRRFCVPGDLLFCVLLNHFGAASSTSVQFSAMLDGNTQMRLPAEITGSARIVDTRERELLTLFLDGKRQNDARFVSSLCEQYVRFSGKTFPDILVPLMRSASVMINPDRPLVIYKDMSIQLNDLAWSLASNAEGSLSDSKNNDAAVDALTLNVANTDIAVNGRKGAVHLRFSIEVSGQQIGTGEKNMVLSGLREYDESAMRGVVDQYNEWRSAYAAA